MSSICKDRLKLFLLFVEARKEPFAFNMYSLPWLDLDDGNQSSFSVVTGGVCKDFHGTDGLMGWQVGLSWVLT